MPRKKDNPPEEKIEVNDEEKVVEKVSTEEKTFTLTGSDLKSIMAELVQGILPAVIQQNSQAVPGDGSTLAEGLQTLLDRMEENRPSRDAEEAQERKRRATELPRGKLQYRDVRELHDMVVGKDMVPFFIGLSKDAPFKTITILGIDFPKTIGIWDEEERQMNTQRGVITKMSVELAEEIVAYAKHIWFKATRTFYRRYWESFDREYLQIDQRFDTFHKRDEAEVRHGRARSLNVKDSDGRQLEEWICLADIILIEQKDDSDLSLDPTSALVVENKTLRQRIKDYEKLLSEGNADVLEKIRVAHGVS